MYYYGELKINMKTYKEKRALLKIREERQLMNDFIICSQCIYWEECENKESRDGCYFGENEDECNENMDG